MEIGRRRLRDRIRKLEKQIEQLSAQRHLRRKRRNEGDLPVLSIIGYTNAGKSTLLNALTNSKVEVADQLFMTLDPTSRRLRFPREGEVVITDTVGFLSDLPKDLVNAFRATLEELADANLLLHVIDISDERFDEHKRAVEELLADLEVAAIPRLLILNKADRVSAAKARELEEKHGGVAVSALRGEGLEHLIEVAERELGRERPLLRNFDREE